MTPAPSGSHRKRLERLESLTSRHASLLAASNGPDRSGVSSRDEHLAVTVDHQSYPAKTGSGVPKFPIRFLDATFTKSPGRGSLTTQERGDPTAEYDTIAASITGHWIEPGTIVKALWQRPPAGISTEDGGEWFVEPYEQAILGRIVFTLKTDRTRELKAGKTIGYAQATIDDFAGTIGHAAGATVEVVFADKRWYGSVKGCQGIADYIDGEYIVTDCQELTAGFWARTLEDREPGAPLQDVRVSYVQQTGHANADFPAPDYFPNQSPPPQCPSVTWQWEVTQQRWIPIVLPSDTACCVFDNTTEPPPPQDTQKPGQTIVTWGNFVPGPDCVPDPGYATLKVRFIAGTFPRMKKGALCWVTHENDIGNESSNEGMRWYVVQCDQLPIHISGVLEEKVCGVDFTVQEAEEHDVFPNGLPIPDDMFPLTISNPRKHEGRIGSLWGAHWNKLTGTYECDDMELVTGTVPLNLTQTTDQYGCTTISWQNLSIAFETCAEPQEGGSYKYKKSTAYKLTDVTVTTGEQGSGSAVTCSPKQVYELEKIDVYTPCDAAYEPTDPVEQAMLSKWTTIDVADDGDCIYQTRIQYIIPAVCGDEVDRNVVCTTDEQCDGSA